MEKVGVGDREEQRSFSYRRDIQKLQLLDIFQGNKVLAITKRNTVAVIAFLQKWPMTVTLQQEENRKTGRRHVGKPAIQGQRRLKLNSAFFSCTKNS